MSLADNLRKLGAIILGLLATLPFYEFFIGPPDWLAADVFDALTDLTVVLGVAALWVWTDMPLVPMLAWAIPLAILTLVLSTIPFPLGPIVYTPVFVVLVLLVFSRRVVNAWCNAVLGVQQRLVTGVVDRRRP